MDGIYERESRYNELCRKAKASSLNKIEERERKEIAMWFSRNSYIPTGKFLNVVFVKRAELGDREAA